MRAGMQPPAVLVLAMLAPRRSAFQKVASGGQAAHVERAVSVAQAKPAPGHLADPAVLQRMERQSQQAKSRRNVQAYAADFYSNYRAIIDDLIDREGFVVRGHASGKKGSGMNQATKDDLRKLRDRVRERNGSVELSSEEDQEWGSKAEKVERLPQMVSSSKELMYLAYCDAKLRARWAREEQKDPSAAFLEYLNAAWEHRAWPEGWKQFYIGEYESKK